MLRWLLAVCVACSAPPRGGPPGRGPAPPPPPPKVVPTSTIAATPCSKAALTWEPLPPEQQKGLDFAKLVRPITDQWPISAYEARTATAIARWPHEQSTGSAVLAQTEVERDGKKRKTTGAQLEPRLSGMFAAAVNRDELAVWGGVVDVDPALTSFLPRALDTGAILDLKAGVWTALPAAGAPSPRSRAQALLTDKELVIWGGLQHKEGSTATTHLFDGAIYTRKTGTWRPIAPVDPALQGTYDAVTLFLDGRTLVIWTSERHTWLYDLDAGTWLPADVTCMPNALRGYARFSVGGRHIVLPSAAGAIFNLATRDWTPITALGDLAEYGNLNLAMRGNAVLILGGLKGVEEGCGGGSRPGRPACDTIHRDIPLEGMWQLRLPSP